MRLHHVSIPVPSRQLAAGRAFYADIVGLPKVSPPESLGPERVAWFDLGDCELHLFIEDDANIRSSRRHLAIAVDNLEAVQQRLSNHAISIEDAEPIHNRPRFFFHDPFGNVVEMTQLLGPYR